MISLLFVLTSCFGGRAYYNENNQYVPKNPKFTLKDKPNNKTPKNLAINAVYKMIAMYNNNQQIYPTNIDSLNQVVLYIKFYENGRCLSFSIPVSETLSAKSLNPNTSGYHQHYYYSNTTNSLETESFVYGAGKNHYVITNYKLTDDGSTLTFKDKTTEIIYRKVAIPSNWNRHKASW